jgi:ABC-type nitrate/sulfonate/bicarbonate transport system substrate-binding protein
MSQSQPLDALWYTRCPVPTGLGIAVQKGWLEESFNAQSTEIKSLRESNDQSIRESQAASNLRGRNAELVGLIRGEVDAIFLKGAQAVQIAHQFNLHLVIDTGSHPDPLIRANNGTPRTLTVDQHLLDQHFNSAVNIVVQVLRAEQWASQHPEDTRRYLARETNSGEYWVTQAYGKDAHLRLKTDLAESSIIGLQDFANFLHRWNFIPDAVNVREWIDPRPLELVLENLKRSAA